MKKKLPSKKDDKNWRERKKMKIPNGEWKSKTIRREKDRRGKSTLFFPLPVQIVIREKERERERERERVSELKWPRNEIL